MSPFTKRVIEVVQMIPPGKVVSYGQVAVYVGAPRAARQVGWILRETGGKNNIPWWRVVNKNGLISIKGNFEADRELQKKLLEAEQIDVKDFQVNMQKYRFIPSEQVLNKLQLSDKYIDDLSYKL